MTPVSYVLIKNGQKETLIMIRIMNASTFIHNDNKHNYDDYENNEDIVCIFSDDE